MLDDRNICLVIIVVVLVVMAGCERWKWNECRGVGHSRLYCFTKVFGK